MSIQLYQECVKNFKTVGRMQDLKNEGSSNSTGLFSKSGIKNCFFLVELQDFYVKFWCSLTVIFLLFQGKFNCITRK